METDALSQEELYRSHAPAIHRRCRQMLGSGPDIPDAVHDIFVQLYRALPQFEGRAQITTWIYRITTNHCLNRLRALRNAGKAIEILEERIQLGPRDDWQGRVERSNLAKAVLSLVTERQAMILFFYFCDGMSQLEIAEALEVSDRTVRSELRQAEMALRPHSPLFVEEGVVYD